MFFEMREKLLKVRRYDFTRDRELLADGIGDLFVRQSAFQEFEHARTDEVQSIHLSMKDVEDNGPVRVMC